MKMFIPSSEKIGTNVEDSKPLVLTIDESKLYQEPFREMLFGMAVDACGDPNQLRPAGVSQFLSAH
jgi:hypothetical protein